MAIRDLIVRISAQSSDFERRIAAAQRSLATLSERASSLAGTAFTGLTLPLGAFGAAALKSAADFEGLRRGLEAVTGSAAQAERQMVSLKKVAELPGLGLREAIQGSIRLQAVGFNAQLAERTLKAVGNALVTVGAGRDELAGVIRAFSQIEGKGKVFAEEINQVAERLPQVRAAMKAAFGTANTEEIQKLGLTSKQFIEGIVAEFEKLPPVTGGLKNSFENLKDNIEIALAQAGNAIAPFAQAAIDALTPLIGLLGQAGQAFQQLPQPVQSVTVALLGLAAAVGPISFIVSKLAELRIAILAAQTALVANPLALLIGAGALAAGGAIALTVDQLNELERRYDSLGRRDGARRTLEQLAEAAKNGDAEIKAFAAGVGDFGIRVAKAETAVRPLADAFRALNIATFGDAKKAADEAKAALDQIVAAYKRGEATTFDVQNATAAYHAVLRRMGLETAAVTEKHKAHGEAVKSLAQAFRDVEEAIRGRQETARLTQELFRLQDAAAAGEAGIIPLLPAVTSLDQVMREAAASATSAVDVLGQVFDARKIDAANDALEQFGITSTRALEGLKIEVPKSSFEVIQDVLDAQNRAAQQAALNAGKVQFPKKEASEFGRQVSTVLTDLSRGIVDVIAGTKSLGAAMLGVAQEASRAILRYFIEQGTKQVISALGQVISKLFDVQDVFGSLFGSTAKTTIRATSSAVSSAGTSASRTAGAFGDGTGGILTGISSAISAVFDVLQFTQLRRIEQDIGRIEVTSRGQLNQTISIQQTLNTWLPFLGGIQNLLSDGGVNVQRASDVPQQITFNIYETGNARSTLTAVARELRTLGVVRG